MQKVLNHVSDRSSHLTGKRRKNFQRLVRGGYSSTLSYDVIHGVFLFCLHLLKWKRKWPGWILWPQIKVECYFTFCILIRSQDWTFGLRLQFGTVLSVKDKMTQCAIVSITELSLMFNKAVSQTLPRYTYTAPWWATVSNPCGALCLSALPIPHLISYSLKTVVKRNCVQSSYTYTYNTMLWWQMYPGPLCANGVIYKTLQ